MKEFHYEIQPGGNANELTLIVDRQDGQNGEEVTRPLPDLDKVFLDRLRAGEPAPHMTQKISLDLTRWLLAGDEALIRLKDALKQADAFRLVIKVNQRLLESSLADVPFELLELPQHAPLVLNPRVRSMVHLLSKVSTSPVATVRTWPLRILIVRSNPTSLGGAVPPAKAIGDGILACAKQSFGQDGLVEVNVISREAGVDIPATWANVRAELEGSATPHVLAFLGHADHAIGHAGGTQAGRLLFESEDGADAEPVIAAILNTELQSFPVPVVLLAGCYTAADLQNKAAIESLVPDWMRAHQGVAQALINSGSGVQIAVGMRYRLDTSDATRFLTKFFQTLISAPVDAPDIRGDVELAVRGARHELSVNPKASTPSFSAPVVFRTLAPEPTFPFLRERAPTKIDPLDIDAQRIREKFWNALCQLSIGDRANTFGMIGEILTDTEDRFLARSAEPVLALRQVDDTSAKRTYGETTAGGTVKIALELRGAFRSSSIRGRVISSDATAAIRAATGTQALVDAGFDSTFAKAANDPPNILRFELRPLHPSSAGEKLPENQPLLTFEIEVTQTVPIVHTMQIEIGDTLPKKPLRGWSNAILVSAT